MKVVVYLFSLIVTVCCIALASEFALKEFLPEAYRGYLIEDDDGNVKWTIGPFEPGHPSLGFNEPIKLKKPADTLRIISLGASGTEGWLSAKTVFNKYSLKSEAKDFSSYSRVIEYSMNEISDASSKNIEVINLGIAAYNIADVIRMLKDSLKLDPDLLVIQIGGNETWTAERSNWSSYVDDDIPYLYSELAYEIFTGALANWQTLSGGGNAFNPMALFDSGARPIVMEPPGRAAGIDNRLANFERGLERLGDFLKRKQIPVLFLIPSQNIADFQPFGSMAKAGTNAEQLQNLNELLVAALAAPAIDAEEKYREILELDDGIAEANFQLAKIYLGENRPDAARELFWRANDRDLVLKRLPSAFYNISRDFVTRNGFPYIDVMKFYESKSSTSVVGYNWLDDDVHPRRLGQFDLGNEIINIVFKLNLLQSNDYVGNLQKLPGFDDYNQWTGFDRVSAGAMVYIKAAHNFLAFGRFRQRLRWDPNPDEFLGPILDDLAIANSYAPSDSSLYLSAVLNIFLGRQENAASIVEKMDCRSSVERAAQINWGMISASRQVIGNGKPRFETELQRILELEGCTK